MINTSIFAINLLTASVDTQEKICSRIYYLVTSERQLKRQINYFQLH